MLESFYTRIYLFFSCDDIIGYLGRVSKISFSLSKLFQMQTPPRSFKEQGR